MSGVAENPTVGDLAMVMASNSSITKLGLSLVLMMATSLTANAVMAQSADIIRIGDSPDEQQFYRSYWDRLQDLSSQVAPERSSSSTNRTEVDPQADLEKIIRNLIVRDLFLEPIIRLNGSSQLSGLLTNQNKIPVTVSAVNFEVLDKEGFLVQTGSAKPEPSTLAPGQTVTFTRVMLTVPADAGYEVKLSEPTFAVVSDPSSDLTPAPSRQSFP